MVNYCRSNFGLQKEGFHDNFFIYQILPFLQYRLFGTFSKQKCEQNKVEAKQRKTCKTSETKCMRKHAEKI